MHFHAFVLIKRLVSAQHCGCHKFVWDVVTELMGGDAATAEKSKARVICKMIFSPRTIKENSANGLLISFLVILVVMETTKKCVVKEGFNFKSPLIESDLCDGTRKKQLKTSQKWTCGA